MKAKLEGGDELVQKLDRVGRRMVDYLPEAALAGAEVIRAAADEKAPGSGAVITNLRSPQMIGNQAKVQVEIGPDRDHWYYLFFELGADAHEIKARDRKALLFAGNEGETVRKAVQQPGITARPFLRPALDNQAQRAVEALANVLRRIINNL